MNDVISKFDVSERLAFTNGRANCLLFAAVCAVIAMMARFAPQAWLRDYARNRRFSWG